MAVSDLSSLGDEPLFTINPKANSFDLINEADWFSSAISDICFTMGESDISGSALKEVAGVFHALGKMNELSKRLYQEAHSLERAAK